MKQVEQLEKASKDADAPAFFPTYHIHGTVWATDIACVATDISFSPIKDNKAQLGKTLHVLPFVASRPYPAYFS